MNLYLCLCLYKVFGSIFHCVQEKDCVHGKVFELSLKINDDHDHVPQILICTYRHVPFMPL